jgi:hypothetical protein
MLDVVTQNEADEKCFGRDGFTAEKRRKTRPNGFSGLSQDSRGIKAFCLCKCGQRPCSEWDTFEAVDTAPAVFTHGQKTQTDVAGIKTDVARMWINPRSNLNHGGHSAWNRRATDIWHSRYLELAEVALRPRSQEPKQANDAVRPLPEDTIALSSGR